MQTVAVKLNLELACANEVLRIACAVRPPQATLVPEKREEITTEGGLDAVGNKDAVARAISELHDAGSIVSLFLDPDERQIELAAELGADAVELHTGCYANTAGDAQHAELTKLAAAGKSIRQAGMVLHAGHGLTYRNVRPIAEIAGMDELNIGHSIVSRAIFTGMREAVREMKRLIS
jgi:pyridoxine 5-phosphate synthase